MWTPSPRLRWVLLAGAAATLIAVVFGGLVGPATQLTYNAPSRAATLQVQLLSFGAYGSALAFSLAFLRPEPMLRSVPILAGLLVGGVGFWLSFLYWVPVGGNAAVSGAVAPYSLPGADLLVWGVLAFVMGCLLLAIPSHAWSATSRSTAPPVIDAR